MSNTITQAVVAATPSQVDDLDGLLPHCLAGEEWAFVKVYNQYASLIYRLSISILNDRQDAEEVLQDTFEYAFRKIEKFDPKKASFKTWLYQIAVSRCRNKRRRKWLPTIQLNQLIGQQVPDRNTPSPADEMDLSERQQTVWNALADLSPKLQETAVLRYYEGLTYAEIGRVLSIPAKTAESRMRLAHKSLRKILTEDFDQK
jgi:RNA polymerase sigma-70 factor (ECF subfamily)